MLRLFSSREVLYPITAVVDGYAINPGRELGVASKATNGAKNGDENLLANIERIFSGATHHSQCDVEYWGLVRSY